MRRRMRVCHENTFRMAAKIGALQRQHRAELTGCRVRVVALERHPAQRGMSGAVEGVNCHDAAVHRLQLR